MKAPILSPTFKWVAAKDHLTNEGREQFLARQRARIAAAQANSAEAAAKVRVIAKVRTR